MSRRPRRQPPRRPSRRRARGAALLTAMIIVSLVATLAASMVWQQWRAVQVEVAERARAQSAWILAGALDWAGLVLREDTKPYTSLNEPWAVPLAEARLSSFLAADKDNNADDGPEAFLSGSITDAQSRFNLKRLINPTPKEKIGIEAAAETAKAFERLCQSIGVSSDVAASIVAGMQSAGAASSESGDPAPLMPASVAQLAWFGVDAGSIALLEPYVVVLPDMNAAVNPNTASREVLAAVLDLDLASAERLIQKRRTTPLTTLEELNVTGTAKTIPATAVVLTPSTYFEVRGRLRLGDRALEQRSLVKRESVNGRKSVTVLTRERVSTREATGS